MIEMKNINKSYKMGQERLQVLTDICFSVESGEFVAILGPSGSGKSTLMNLIGCMDRSDSGEYYLDGHAVHEYPDNRLAAFRNREIGFIFQKYQLIAKYSVLQNVIMPLILRGMPRKEAAEQCMAQIELLGLSDRLAHKPAELSGGQQQRVAIARALAGNPAILLADEPTGALDSGTGKEVLGIFARLNEMGHTIIMITHDLNVAAYAKRVVNIVDGRLRHGSQNGTPVDILP